MKQSDIIAGRTYYGAQAALVEEPELRTVMDIATTSDVHVRYNIKKNEGGAIKIASFARWAVGVMPQPGEAHTINRNALQLCKNDLLGKKLVPPSDEALTKLLSKNFKLVARLNHWYRKTNSKFYGGLDTYEREWLLDLVANELAGMEWPRNSDSEEYFKKFIHNLHDGVAAKGWSFAV